MANDIKILVITPVKHINSVSNSLELLGDVDYLDDPEYSHVLKVIPNYNIIFTNPNKSKVFLGEELLRAGKNLKVIVTASTGTNHIDKNCVKEIGLKIISLTEERKVIDKISSTAELAFALTLNSIRNVMSSHKNAIQGEWDYTKYIGRQMNALTFGVVGYGRLGKMYANYCKAFGAKVVAYDPYKNINNKGVKQLKSMNELLPIADVISIHVHVSSETTNMFCAEYFSKMKNNVLIVNTSRGEIINEKDLIIFLKKNPKAKVATDVLANEIKGRKENLLVNYALENDNILITQHIGGMTSEAQELAYNHVIKKLQQFLNKKF
jgi:D-3-phosphoglycerate dehydrogenase